MPGRKGVPKPTSNALTEPSSQGPRGPREGCPPHGGPGPGPGLVLAPGPGLVLMVLMVLMALLGLDSIREATFLFRGPNRLTP